MRAEVIGRIVASPDASGSGERRSELRVIFPSDPLAVRDALISTLGGLRNLHLDDDEASTVELVLAEVLNNVVEHSYAGGRTGMIELQITHCARGLRCAVVDDGAPMPTGMPPRTTLPDSTVPLDDQPEGGFGWFLIRELATDLAYARRDGRNRLSFGLPVATTIRTS